jgi:hypothetical protein|tara:strand:+ start:1494 stop:1814 length:321 start_codon:yes stop_codon:yes gene_type:complete
LPEEVQCNCQEKELQQLKNELHKCKTNGQVKDRKIQKLDKKLLILMCIVVGVGAIFGKEALDSIAEWLSTVGSIKSGVQDMVILPAPGALPLLAMPLLFGGRRRRK